MRTYGRTYDVYGNPTWVEVTTDANGYNDEVYSVALIQCLKLNVGESPFWADWGLPAHPSVVQQVFPDYWMALMQQRFSPYFASLTLAKLPSISPTYQMVATTHQGVTISQTIPV